MGHGLEGGLLARKRQSNLVRGKLSHQKDKQGFINYPSKAYKIRLSESKQGSPFQAVLAMYSVLLYRCEPQQETLFFFSLTSQGKGRLLLFYDSEL